MVVTPVRLAAKLTDPALAASLSHFVRARVPESDAQDIVQSTLTEALDAEQHPEEDEEIVRWVHGICRHKVIDWFRRARREIPRDLESGEEGPVAAAESVPQSAIDLLRWAKKELPAGEENAKTLEWMLREGAGEKLETIAAEANVPAPRVRQRVSRLRRYYKARWAAQAAAVAALLLIALAIALALRQKPEQIAPAPGPSFAPEIVAPPPPSVPETPAPERPATSAQAPDPQPQVLPQVPPPQAQVPPTSSAPDDSKLSAPQKPTPPPVSTAVPAPKKKPTKPAASFSDKSSL